MTRALAGLAQKPLRLCGIRIAQIRHVAADRLNIEFELHVVGIAEDQRWAVSGINGSCVRDPHRIEMRCPALQFVSVHHSERQVVKADPPFIECSGFRGRIVAAVV
jgi:hypothetical protein